MRQEPFDCCFTCFCWKPGCGDGFFLQPHCSIQSLTSTYPFVGMEKQLQRRYQCLPKISISAPQIAITPSSSADMLCCGCGRGVFPSGGLVGRLLHAQPTANSANPCNSSVHTQIFVSNAFPLKIAGLVPVSRCKYLLYDKYL